MSSAATAAAASSSRRVREPAFVRAHVHADELSLVEHYSTDATSTVRLTRALVDSLCSRSLGLYKFERTRHVAIRHVTFSSRLSFLSRAGGPLPASS